MVESGYDAVAGAYTEQFRHELDAKPFDRTMLDWLAARVGTLGRICDMGCGPGQVAAYLHEQGASVCGMDISFEMVRHASLEHPTIAFTQSDMTDLSAIANASFGGVAAFYSIVNIDPHHHPRVFGEFHRVLRPGGVLLLSFHLGSGSTHYDELLGRPVALDFYFRGTDDVRAELEAAGFAVTEAIERDPYPPTVEHPTRRAYLFAVA